MNTNNSAASERQDVAKVDKIERLIDRLDSGNRELGDSVINLFYLREYATLLRAASPAADSVVISRSLALAAKNAMKHCQREAEPRRTWIEFIEEMESCIDASPAAPAVVSAVVTDALRQALQEIVENGDTAHWTYHHARMALENGAQP